VNGGIRPQAGGPIPMPYGLPTGSSTPFDADAAVYLRRVEDADGQALEQGVRDAITNFVFGCKSDGIWSAIRFSCILMGARTLSGALIPLVGAAPTNSNFVSGDYTRRGANPGLRGNGTNKQLNSNRANNADGRDDCHVFAYMTGNNYIGSNSPVFGSAWFSGTDRFISWAMQSSNLVYVSANNAPQNIAGSGAGATNGGWGVARSGSSAWSYRTGSPASSRTEASVAPSSGNIFFFSLNSNFYNSHRLSFISIGSALDLDTLNARVESLQAAISGALP
jgi:hypothetical protein